MKKNTQKQYAKKTLKKTHQNSGCTTRYTYSKVGTLLKKCLKNSRFKINSNTSVVWSKTYDFLFSAREVLLTDLDKVVCQTRLWIRVANVHLYNSLPFLGHSILRLELPHYPWDQFMSYCKFWMSASGHFPLIGTKWKLDQTVWYAKLFLWEFLEGFLSNVLVRWNCCSEAICGMMLIWLRNNNVVSRNNSVTRDTSGTWAHLLTHCHDSHMDNL